MTTPAAQAAPAPQPPAAAASRRGAEPAGPPARRGPVGARLPRAANPNERSKKDDDGLNVRARIENIYSHRGFASIDPSRPARPVPLVGPVHPARRGHRRRPHRDASSPRSSTRRTSCCGSAIDGGRLTLEQLRAIADDLHRRTAATPPTSPTGRTSSCTGSGSRTCRRSGSGSRPSGLTTAEACGDTPRVILGSPVAGVDPDEIVDGTPGDRGDPPAVRRRPARSPTCRASSRPRSAARRTRTSRTRSTTSRSSACATPSTAPGFDVWVGGGLSTNPHLAQRLGAFVTLDEVPERVGRRRRHLPRLRVPAAAHQGPAEVPGRRLGRRAVPRGAGEGVPRPARCATARRRPTPPRGRRDHLGVHPQTRRPLLRRRQADRRPAVRLRAGRRSPTRSRTPAADEVRLTVEQSVVVTGRARRPGRRAGRRRCAALGPRAAPAHLPPRHHGVHRHRVLQARDHRDQGHAPAPGGRARGPAPRPSTSR